MHDEINLPPLPIPFSDACPIGWAYDTPCDDPMPDLYSACDMHAYARAALASQTQAPTASGGAEGFWLAPMEPDMMMLDAYCNQSGNFQSARSDWNAMRDSWLCRHPAPPSAQPVGEPSDLAGAIAWLKSEEMNAGPRTLKAIATVLASLPAAPVAAPEPVAHGPINCAHDSGVTCGQDGQHCATFIKCSAMGCQRPAAPQPLPPAAQQQAPAGWVMAPREPTEAMELAAEVLKPRGYADLYRAMFAAAPSLGAMGESEHG